MSDAENIRPRTMGASQVTAVESSRASNYDNMGQMLRGHIFDELIKTLAETSFAVCHSDERVCLVVENCLGSRSCRVNDTDDS